MKLKIKMHSLLNRLAFWAIFPVCIIGGFCIYRDAANNDLRIFGLAFSFLVFVFSIYLFIFKFCIYDYAIFTDEGIELHTPFKKKAFFKYNELNACVAKYTSIIEFKKYLTFTSKNHNSVVTHIDTSKYGNAIHINKMQVIYVPARDDIIEFLKDKTDLQWYVSR